jgi:glucokinase
MSRTIGVLATRSIRVGVVEDHQLAGPVRRCPDQESDIDLKTLPVDDLIRCMRDEIKAAAAGRPVDSVGAGFPGVVRNGVIEESPNLGQLKGLRARDELSAALRAVGIDAPVLILNDADALAAGIATTHKQLEKLIRVWYLGDGIGFGRYPRTEGVWEGGHMVVSLDPKERYCGCGGVGHLEGIMGHRAMRLRFLDMEPEEVFAEARQGDSRCADFVKRWHRALAAATATSVHLDGPGKFFIAGPNAQFIDVSVLSTLMHDMVKMSPLQGSMFEVVATGHEIAVIGAAVSSSIRPQ